jgi:hypothetical protein
VQPDLHGLLLRRIVHDVGQGRELFAGRDVEPVAGHIGDGGSLVAGREQPFAEIRGRSDAQKARAPDILPALLIHDDVVQQEEHTPLRSVNMQ